MLKIIGYILILGAFTAAGFAYAENFRKRVKQLNEIQRAVYQLENEIEFTHTPLPEAINKVAEKTDMPLKQVLLKVSDILYCNCADSVYDAFKIGFQENENIVNLKKEDINVILDLAKGLGESDIYGQKKLFSLTIENLKKQLKIAEVLMDKSVKMYRYLGFSLGAVIIIMLI